MHAWWQKASVLLVPLLAGTATAMPATADPIAGSDPATVADEVDDLLPRPQALEPAVAFWTRVYSEVGTDGGFIHDARYLDVVYEVVRFPSGAGSRGEHRHLSTATGRYRSLFDGLAAGKAPDSAEARRIAELWRPHGAAALREAAERVRFQRGQANRFREGLSRSGAWLDYINETLREAGVPTALGALPHVESSFDPTARSHADARGLWQFTASTGRRYMQIDHVVDERMDPYLSTRAAAHLLRHNYEVTGSWPLAITAYNHGAAGVRRAVEQLGTGDIGVIAWEYRGRSFGFASRNFYAAFLAALDVEARAEALFGPVPRSPAAAIREAAPPDYLGALTLAGALGVDIDLLRRYNPALQPTVWNGEKRWPRGFPVRVPGDQGAPDLDLALATIPDHERHDDQVPDQYHRVGRGEALSLIAARYGTSVPKLVALNELGNPDRIRAGTVLRLPGAAPDEPAAIPAVLVASAMEPPAPSEDLLAELAAHSDAAAAGIETQSIQGDVIGMPRELGADPSDLDVAADGTIEIQPFETLGHYAEWLKVSPAALRHRNGLHRGSSLVVGKRLRLDLAHVDKATFEGRRTDYHRALQEAFFARYRIVGTVEHSVRAGDSLWRLTRFTQVPMWLMRQYNPDLDFAALRPGASVLVPVLEATDEQEATAPVAVDCVC